jgi:hypothetical protein
MKLNYKCSISLFSWAAVGIPEVAPDSCRGLEHCHLREMP